MKIIDRIQMIIEKTVSTIKKGISFFKERQGYEKVIIFYAIAAVVFIIYWLIKK